MIDYKNIAKSYGVNNCGYIKFIILRFINECIDATSLVYLYISAVKNRSIFRYYYRRKLIRRYGIFIGDHAQIDKGLRLPHPIGIIIGDGVNIKQNVTIFQNVTLGSKSINANKYPIIENGTTIFAGATIIGDITLGECSIIGANSFVNVCVESKAVYAGIPARKVSYTVT